MVVTREFRSQFLEWALAQGSCLSHYVSVGDSTLGGTGVFFALKKYVADNGPIHIDDQIEVIRVPKYLSYSLDSFKDDLLPRQREFDRSLPEGLLRQSDVVVKLLELFYEGFNSVLDPFVKGGINETNILVGQVQILISLKEVRERLILKDQRYEELKKAPFAAFDNYWELLKKTEVPSTKVDQYYEQYLKLFMYNEREYRHRIERIKYDAVYNALDAFEVEYSDFVNDDFLKRIELSVISRLLEIPEALAKVEEEGRHGQLNSREVIDPRTTYAESGHETADEKKEYGFAVSSTLVPIIDFVNHSNDYLNAFFDVDPQNNDVLLRLYNEKFTNENDMPDQIELFIRYSDYEDVLKFVHAYGFIPRSHKRVRPIYEHAIDRAYLSNFKVESEIDGDRYDHNLGLLLKWLRVQPSIQFVVQYDPDGELDSVRMNLDENFIVFGFLKGMKYSKDAALAIVKHYSDYQNDDYISELLSLEESEDNDIIGGYDVIPYSSAYVDGPLNLETILDNVPDEEINELMISFIDWFAEYSKSRIHTLEKELSEMSDSDSIVYQFAQFEKNLLGKFCEQVVDSSDYEKLDLIIGAEDLDPEWLKNRLAPRLVKAEDRMDLYTKYTTKGISTLKVDDKEE
jgi:hypothetical protein